MAIQCCACENSEKEYTCNLNKGLVFSYLDPLCLSDVDNYIYHVIISYCNVLVYLYIYGSMRHIIVDYITDSSD